MNNKGEKLLGTIGMVIFLTVAIAVLVSLDNSCDGTLVRGLIFLECIKN